jgi:hypothetical protein
MRRTISLRPAFSAGISTTALGGRPYRFKPGVWMPVENDRDALYLMSTQPWGGMKLEAERELGPLWVTSPVPRSLRLPRYRGDTSPAVQVAPGGLTPITRVQASSISDHALLNSVTCARFLRAKPQAKIAIVRGGNLGDALFVGAAVSALRRVFADSVIDYVTAEVFAELVGGISLWEGLERAPYDAVFDYENLLEGSPDASVYDRVELSARRAGLVDAWPMSVSVSADDLEYGRQATGKVCLALRATSAYREMSAEWEAGLIAALDGLDVFTLSARDGRSSVWHFNGSLGKMAGLIAHSAVVVAVDSGPLHVAQALGRPLIGLFGPVRAELRVRTSETAKVFCGNAEAGCTPCAATTARCALPAPCLDRIDVQAVARSVRELFHGHSPCV